MQLHFMEQKFWRMELIEQMKAGRGKGGKQLIMAKENMICWKYLS